MVGEATRSRRIQHPAMQQQQQQQASTMPGTGKQRPRAATQQAAAAAAASAKGQGATAAAGSGGRTRGRGRGRRGRGRDSAAAAAAAEDLAAAAVDVKPKSESTSSSEESDLVVKRKRRAPVSDPVQQQQQQAPQCAAAAAAEGDSPAEALTLVLFDEADTLLDTDRGFLAALPGLIKDSRRPIVLCLNSPTLPAALAGTAVQQVTMLRPQQVCYLHPFLMFSNSSTGCLWKGLSHRHWVVATHSMMSENSMLPAAPVDVAVQVVSDDAEATIGIAICNWYAICNICII